MTAVAVTCAVITGSLIVGDSVRISLSRLVLDRLGQVDSVLTAKRFVHESLVSRLNINKDFQKHSIVTKPAIALPGSAVRPVGNRRASKVRIYGVEENFGDLFEETLTFAGSESQVLPGAVINASLSLELAAQVGDQVLFQIMGTSDINPESLLGKRDAASVVRSVLAVITQIVNDKGVGQFELNPSQLNGFNAYLPLEDLQRVLGKKDRVNLILFKGSQRLKKDQFKQVVRRVLTVKDHGFRFRHGEKYLSIESSSFILNSFQLNSLRNVTDRLKIKSQAVLTYLANRLETKSGMVPYSTVTAVDPINVDVLPRLILENGKVAGSLMSGFLYINSWAAHELVAGLGDSVEMTYYGLGPRNELLTRKEKFQVAGIVAMREMGSDDLLTLEYPGIYEVEDMAEWDPPFPVDLGQIRPQDEEYWDQFKAIPKAFLSLEQGRELWTSRFGSTTSFRIAYDSSFPVSVLLEKFNKELKKELSLESGGFRLRELRREGMEAAQGPTDFSRLFIAFSLFLILSALLLVALLFRLSVEKRSKEVGICLAVGYEKKRIIQRLLVEVGPLLVVGSLLGTGLALAYGWAILTGLRTFWNEIVGTELISLYFTLTSLMVGFVATIVSAVLSLWLSVRKLVILSPTNLLVGRLESRCSGSGRLNRLMIRGSAFLSIFILFGIILFKSHLQDLEGIIFFALGVVILVLTLSLVSWKLDSLGVLQTSVTGQFSILKLSLSNIGRTPSRSLVSIVLVSLSCFAILAVEASRTTLSDDLNHKNAPTGGFELLAQTNIPVLQDLNSDSGRFDFGIDDTDALLEQSLIYPFRVLPGDDASCLNLYRPQEPRILGVSADFIERGGFHFHQLTEDLSLPEKEKPWRILEKDLGEGVFPAIGDYESVRWILKSGLGKDLEILDEQGFPFKLRLMGLLDASIFQSEILVSEKAFQRLFPSRNGYSYFLVDTPQSLVSQVTYALENWLVEYGLDAAPVKDRLSRYFSVRNTYVTTFQALGGLGLLLGTVGLGVVLLRNVLERSSELALMRAFGFSRGKLCGMVLVENLWLLSIGIICGTLAASVALLPNLWNGLVRPSWISLLSTLILVVMVGMGASSAGMVAFLRTSLVSTLKEE